MELYLDIYETADKGIASNVVLDDQTVLEIQKKVKDAGYPIATMVTYSNMENYESVDSFLKECMEGKRGSVVIYEIHNDGGLGRMKFIFDGTDMYVVSTRGIWNADNKPGISYISYTRLKEWKYTEKGWFCYELCVPEPPEVSEIMDGSCLIRIKPMTGEQCEMSERCVRGLGYQGQNLLCSNWNVENMSELDYNGMFEYLYGMKYGEKFNSEDYPNGIPKEEFESLIMEYLPITAEQIREYAVFDEENQTYLWARLGCFNYAPTFFGTSLPEVVDIKENQDGTVTLTVEAVCDMVICDDAVITHELTVRFAEDEVVITTHLNTRHYHNHIVWNSVSMADGRKYHSNAKSYYTEIRKISDELCRKYGLSIIESDQKKSIPYVQWKAEQEGKPTWRSAIRLDIRESVQESYSWSQFLKEMEKRGYTWKLNRKYIALKAPGMERYIRLRSLGKNYSEEEIRGQILQPKVKRIYQKPVQIHPKKKLTGIQAL